MAHVQSAHLVARRFSVACALAVVPYLALAPWAMADGLADVVQQALDSNPELGAIRYNRQAIDHELRAARGLRLPSADVKVDAGRHRDAQETALGIKSPGDWHDHTNVYGVVSQRLFDGFESVHEIARQKNRVESARWRVADTANSIALRAVQAYFEVQRARGVVKAARSNLERLESIEKRVQARVSAGQANSAERTEAGARAASARAVLAESEARELDADALYRAVVGSPPGVLAGAGEPKSLPRTVVDAVNKAVDAAPSIIATQHDATAASAAVGTAYSRFYPKLNVEVSAEHGRGIEEGSDRQSDARAMLVVRWNLLNGGIDRARVYEAAARASEAVEINANARRIVERETRVSWNAMTSARARVPALRRQAELNRETRTTYLAQFDTGQRRLLDLLDVQNEVFVAEAALITEEFVGYYNAYRVLAAMGRLVEGLGLVAPGEASEPHSASPITDWYVRDGGPWHTTVHK